MTTDNESAETEQGAVAYEWDELVEITDGEYEWLTTATKRHPSVFDDVENYRNVKPLVYRTQGTDKPATTDTENADTERCEGCNGQLDDDGLCPHCHNYDDSPGGKELGDLSPEEAAFGHVQRSDDTEADR